jgi:hypothetical protein
MPNYVYRVLPFAQLEKLAEFTAYGEASSRAKALRAAGGAPPGAKIKVMFAETAEQAEDLLCQIREPGPTGDD